MLLKERFLAAVLSGELGTPDELGITVGLREFKRYFKDVPKSYAHTFLPAAAIEPGRTYMTHTKFVFRIGTGIYRLHPQLITNLGFNPPTESSNQQYSAHFTKSNHHHAN